MSILSELSEAVQGLRKFVDQFSGPMHMLTVSGSDVIREISTLVTKTSKVVDEVHTTVAPLDDDVRLIMAEVKSLTQEVKKISESVNGLLQHFEVTRTTPWGKEKYEIKRLGE